MEKKLTSGTDREYTIGAEQLGVPVALLEDQVPFAKLICWLTTICNSTPKGPDALFWPLQVLDVHGTQTNIWTNTYTHKIKISK